MRYIPILLLFLMGCQTPSANLLLGTWQEIGSAETIEFYPRTIVLAPGLKLAYEVKGSKLVVQKPSTIVVDKLAMNVFTNRTDVESKSHLEGPYTNWTLPFHITSQELEITWDGEVTRYFRAGGTSSIMGSLPQAALGQPSTYGVVTNAINLEDWDALRRLTKPEMTANRYIKMWETSGRAGNPVHVGKLHNVEVDSTYNLDGKPCATYTFALENQDGTPNPHWLQILVREEKGRSEILDFWEFGW